MFKSTTSGTSVRGFIRPPSLMHRETVEGDISVRNGYSGRCGLDNHHPRVRRRCASPCGASSAGSGRTALLTCRGVSTLYESLPADHDHREGTVTAIGLSLLTGFALMLLYVDGFLAFYTRLIHKLTPSIESLTPHPPHDGDESPTSSTPPTPHAPLHPSSSRSSDEPAHRPTPQHLDSRSPMIPKRLHIRDSYKDVEVDHSCRKQRDSLEGLNATLGLVIHGAADGIALGASSRSGSGSLGLIVFMAVLVHKGALRRIRGPGALWTRTDT